MAEIRSVSRLPVAACASVVEVVVYVVVEVMLPTDRVDPKQTRDCEESDTGET
jgi:hypothetical protein